MNRRRLLRRLATGSLNNVPFGDLVNFATGFGFQRVRISGNHLTLAHPDIREMINLQSVAGGKALSDSTQAGQLFETTFEA